MGSRPYCREFGSAAKLPVGGSANTLAGLKLDCVNSRRGIEPKTHCAHSLAPLVTLTELLTRLIL